MKKAGIILGIFFIIVAILLCVFGLRMLDHSANDNVVEDGNSVVENVDGNVQNENNVNNVVDNTGNGTENQPQNTQPVQNTQPTNPEPVVETTVVEKVITKEISGVRTIEESSLGEPIATKEVIVHITNKRIMMVDENTNSTEPKMLTYCFDVLTPENMKLTLFVTNSVYTLYNVGDMLKVSYQIYQNDKGIQFPLVLNVLDVD